MRINKGTHNWTMCRVKGFGTLSPKWDVLFKPLQSLKAQGSMWKRRQNGHKEPDVMDDSKETVFQLR